MTLDEIDERILQILNKKPGPSEFISSIENLAKEIGVSYSAIDRYADDVAKRVFGCTWPETSLL